MKDFADQSLSFLDTDLGPSRPIDEFTISDKRPNSPVFSNEPSSPGAKLAKQQKLNKNGKKRPNKEESDSMANTVPSNSNSTAQAILRPSLDRDVSFLNDAALVAGVAPYSRQNSLSRYHHITVMINK